ncbi:cytochrome c mitochondrial import factor [Diplodia corticola]|uniref:Cytochrome c mitochondrial import factor n=1 Tax=Diplodia corticola TaxID=236234 RepID=A0A1J9S7J7_9PEZI|nr:cytochrome c mitochondrial import factor [Diplodia corticola]OJD36463.1 cytochrome c mitochondrial import factor [Diplodia corticola]
MPRILHASLRPSASVLLVLGGSAAGGFGYRYWTSAKDASSAAESSTLHPLRFAHYAIADRTPVSSTSSLFTLHARDADATAQQDLQDIWARSVWSVEAKQPQLQIARAYTPLPPTSSSSEPADGDGGGDTAASQFRFLIRRERGGEVSNYLHRLPPDATVELRGPHVAFEIPDDVSEVLFLAGGTGIAPALQVARALQMRGREASMRILWANRKREDCVGGRSDTAAAQEMGSGWGAWLGWSRKEQEEDSGRTGGESGVIVREIDNLKHRAGSGQRLAVDYFVDEEKTFIQPSHVIRHLQEASKPGEKSTGSRLILISGPDGFLDYWAGRKIWAEQGEVQGPLRGALSRIDLKGWRVWKL